MSCVKLTSCYVLMLLLRYRKKALGFFNDTFNLQNLNCTASYFIKSVVKDELEWMRKKTTFIPNFKFNRGRPVLRTEHVKPNLIYPSNKTTQFLVFI
jgi:hypothetical protein